MHKFKSLPILSGAAALAVAGLLAAAPAQATVFNITSDDCSSSCLGGVTPGGTVTVTQDGTNKVKIDVELNTSVLAGFASTGAGNNDLIAFQLNPTSFPSVTETGLTPVFSATNRSANSQHYDGTGDFNYGLACSVVSTSSCNGANVGIGTSLIFDVGATGITPDSFLASTGMQGGELFALDVIGTNGKTGLVDVSVPAPVIGHGLLVLLAVGGVLFGGKLLENRKKLHLQAA